MARLCFKSWIALADWVACCAAAALTLLLPVSNGFAADRPPYLTSIGAIGAIGNREVNINNLQKGPGDLVIGSTEENGWMFIVHPDRGVVMQWNAGRTDLSESQTSTEGDITSFTWWLASPERLVILAAQAYPAEIYRIDIELKDGLPVGTPTNQRVFKEPRWKRVMALGQGQHDGTRVIIAGSYGAGGELILSRDDGATWAPVAMHGGSFDAFRHAQHISEDAAISSIEYSNGRWIVGLIVGHLLKAQQPWLRDPRRMLDAILISDTAVGPFQLAWVEPRKTLPPDLDALIKAERQQNLLHPRLYHLVGEGPQAIIAGGKCLFAAIGADNDFVAPFGGRVVVSRDNGETWHEVVMNDRVRDQSIAYSFELDALLIGTMAKTNVANGEAGTGSLLISFAPGHLAHVANVVTSRKASRVRGDGSSAVGVSAISQAKDKLVVGTVNEGEDAELFLLDTRHAGFKQVLDDARRQLRGNAGYGCR